MFLFQGRTHINVYITRKVARCYSQDPGDPEMGTATGRVFQWVLARETAPEWGLQLLQMLQAHMMHLDMVTLFSSHRGPRDFAKG